MLKFAWKYLKAENKLDRHLLTDAIASGRQTSEKVSEREWALDTFAGRATFLVNIPNDSCTGPISVDWPIERCSTAACTVTVSLFQSTRNLIKGLWRQQQRTAIGGSDAHA